MSCPTKKGKCIELAFFLAIKNMFFKKSMLFLIIIIIGLGFLSTTFSGGVINGLKFTLEEKAISVLTGNVLIEPKFDEDFLLNADEIIKKAEAIPGVVSASAHYNGGLTLEDKHGKKIAAQFKIIDPEREAMTTALDEHMYLGKYLSKHTTGEIMMGSDLTRNHRIQEALPAVDVEAGENIKVIFDNGVEQMMKVRGIYKLQFIATDTYLYLTREDAKLIFGFDDDDLDKASEILIKIDKRGNEKNIIHALKELNVPGDIWSWEDKLGMINQFTESLKVVSRLTGLIGILIAFATIYIIIYINVRQKRSQIGIMKAIGITKRTIMSSYVIQSIFYGIFGGLFGFGLTKLVVQYYTLDPIKMPMGDVIPLIEPITYLYSFIILLIASLIAGYIASRGIIKENILDAIFKG